MATTFSASRSVSLRLCRAARVGVTCLLVTFGLMAVQSTQATTLYGNFVGNTVTYLDVKESSITDPVALFGPPSLDGDNLVFSPTQFSAVSTDAVAAQTVGLLMADIVAQDGHTIDLVMIRELFSFEMTANTNSAVSIAGLLVLVDLTPGHGAATYYAPLTVVGNPAPPYTGIASGTDWVAEAVLDLSGLGITHAAITFNDILQAVSVEGGTSWIEKTSIELIIPEPSSLLLAAAGLVALGWRRRVA
jgi:hypothetical protein